MDDRYIEMLAADYQPVAIPKTLWETWQQRELRWLIGRFDADGDGRPTQHPEQPDPRSAI